MFSRSKTPAAANNNLPGNGTNNDTHLTNGLDRTLPGQGGVVPGFLFTKWLRLHLVDLITMALMGAIGLGVYRARKLLPPPELSVRIRRLNLF